MEIREESEQNLIFGICEKVLKYTLQYFQENMTGVRQISFEPEEHLQKSSEFLEMMIINKSKFAYYS